MKKKPENIMASKKFHINIIYTGFIFIIDVFICMKKNLKIYRYIKDFK